MVIWYMINVKFTKVKRVTHYKMCIRDSNKPAYIIFFDSA